MLRASACSSTCFGSPSLCVRLDGTQSSQKQLHVSFTRNEHNTHIMTCTLQFRGAYTPQYQNVLFVLSWGHVLVQ